MKWSRTHTLIAGLGLLALTNAVALVGVAYNRAGEEAKLRLTQRELRTPEQWDGNRENSGLALSLIWRVPLEQAADTQFYGWYYAGAGGTPGWLDKARMEALGFAVPAAPAYSDRSRARYEKQLPREVLLVLELDGPTHQRALELAGQHVARAEAKLASSPGDKSLAGRVKTARQGLEWETQRNSRLFVVDAGLELDVLRAKYPDTSRYAVVRGLVRPAVVDDKTGKVEGYVGGLSIESINVPFGLREVPGRVAEIKDVDQRNKVPFEATVAFGRRLEPWIIEAVKK
jgi:hypothetical protein